MKYQFDIDDSTIVVDTKELNYNAIWNSLRLKKKHREGADRIISLYNSADFNDRILVITARSWMKPFNREAQRHQADQYRTRRELLSVAQNNNLVRKLIHHRVLKLHSKWIKHRKHLQAPYRLNILELYYLQSKMLD